MTEYASLVVNAESSDLVTARKRITALQAPAKKTEKSVKMMSGAVSNTARNVAFQLQDITVQLQGGVSASRTLSQQLPQLLGSFGAIGAFLGLFAGIASTAFAPMIDKLFAASGAAKLLEESLEKLTDTVKVTKEGTVLLTDEFVRLSKVSREMAEVQLKSRLITAAAATNAAFTQLKTTTEDLEFRLAKAGNAQRGNANILDRLGKEYGITSSQVKELGALQREVFKSRDVESAKVLASAISEIALSGGGATDKFVEMADSTNSLVRELQTTKNITDQLKNSFNDLDNEILNNSETAVKAEKENKKLNEVLAKQLEIKKAAEAREKQRAIDSAQRQVTIVEDSFRSQEEVIRDRYTDQLEIINTAEQLKLDSIKSYNQLRADAEAAYTDALRAETDKRIAIEQSANDMVYQSKLGLVGQIGGLLERQAKEGSAAAKVGYVISQGIQVAQAINSAELAAAGQLAAVAGVPDPSGAVYAAALARSNTARALGYASAGIIAGNAIAGRAQGGQVRAGQPYNVGEYGKEMFVPNTSGRIVPNGESGGGKISLVTNVKIIGGNPDAQVENTVTQVGDDKFVENIVIRGLSNSTSKMGRTLQNTYQMMPKGSR